MSKIEENVVLIPIDRLTSFPNHPSLVVANSDGNALSYVHADNKHDVVWKCKKSSVSSKSKDKKKPPTVC